jgi:hypothetical protein
MANIFYSYNLTGDCNNTAAGAFSLSYSASASAVYAYWVDPISGATFSSGLISNPYVVTGLTGGSYSLFLTDSSTNQSETNVPVNIFVTTGCGISLQTTTDSKCGPANGALRAFTTQNDGQNTVVLYSGDSFYRSGTTFTNSILFQRVTAGAFYAKVIDYGGCESFSNSVIVRDSTTLDFGFYVVDSAACLANSGRIYVTGVTGTPPFSYSWSGTNNVNGITNNFITGLTPGFFSCTVTDFYGCEITKFTRVNYANQLSLVTYSVSQPSCFTPDGSITFIFSGGASPYYYLLSNGDSQILLSNQVTFTGLTANDYILNVTDAGLCTTTANVSLQITNSLGSVSTSKGNQNCANFGRIDVSLFGGTPPYQYVLSNPAGFALTQSSFLNSTTFSSLLADTYTLSVTDSLSSCTYTEQIVVEKIMNFDYNLTVNPTTCGSDNGSITIDVTDILVTGTSYQYSLSNGEQTPFTTGTTHTFSNLPTGNYTVNVTDRYNCIVTKRTNIATSEVLRVNLYPTSCLDGYSGTITALISNQNGPFNLIWSDNVNGQEGIHVTGLTAGTYSLQVSGEGGCYQTSTTTVTCNPISATNYSFKYSSGSPTLNPTGKKSLKNLMYSGYTSLVEDAQNCSLSSATFSVRITIGETPYQFPFYFTQTFENIPDLSYFAGIIETSILTIPNIDSCVIDVDNNVINIVSSVNNNVESYKGESVSFTIIIDYVINCNSVNGIMCVTPTPTPSVTPSATPTPTLTPTPTITPSALLPIYASYYMYNTTDNTLDCYPVSQILFSSSSGLTSGDTVFTDLTLGTPYFGTLFNDNATLSGYTLDGFGTITGTTSAATCDSIYQTATNCSVPNYYYITNRTPNTVTIDFLPIYQAQPTSFDLPNNTGLYGCFCGIPSVSGSSYGITISAITTCTIN